jgi:hypothetical protein
MSVKIKSWTEFGAPRQMRNCNWTVFVRLATIVVCVREREKEREREEVQLLRRVDSIWKWRKKEMLGAGGTGQTNKSAVVKKWKNLKKKQNKKTFIPFDNPQLKNMLKQNKKRL